MTEQVQNIEKKIHLLIEAMNALRSSNTSLKEENKKLKAGMAEQNDRISELTERLSNTQQALAGQRGNDESESSQMLRKQIDQYIAEIDNCIEWLKNA